MNPSAPVTNTFALSEPLRITSFVGIARPRCYTQNEIFVRRSRSVACFAGREVYDIATRGCSPGVNSVDMHHDTHAQEFLQQSCFSERRMPVLRRTAAFLVENLYCADLRSLSRPPFCSTE